MMGKNTDKQWNKNRRKFVVNLYFTYKFYFLKDIERQVHAIV